ncbi:hypothetical protein IGK47_003576 [Enterococcus sp. AZ007]|uniref:Uncharacterized protein n=1 Tax=Candidatus Enterococcus murrayae TaxID=2815321 RepID=A0ABS3HDP5_9ENTE|nr:hypothetical protein [Enterococcus sp. MJM16]
MRSWGGLLLLQGVMFTDCIIQMPRKLAHTTTPLISDNLKKAGWRDEGIGWWGL